MIGPEGALLADTEPASRGLRTLKIADVLVLVAGVASEVYGRTWCRQHQHRRQIRAQFATEHAKDCAESCNSVEAALHRYEEAHRHFFGPVGCRRHRGRHQQGCPGPPDQGGCAARFCDPRKRDLPSSSRPCTGTSASCIMELPIDARRGGKWQYRSPVNLGSSPSAAGWLH